MRTEFKVPLRVFVAMLAHETSKVSPLPSSLHSFEQLVLNRRGDTATSWKAHEISGYGDVFAIANARGDEIIAGTCAQAVGQISGPQYDALRDEILDQLLAAGPIDMVFLTLHGAMVVADYPDCEGDLLKRVRAIVGPSTPVGALLDLHGKLTPAMVDSGAVIIACKDYPHTDYPRCTRQLYSILAAAANSGPIPRTTMVLHGPIRLIHPRPSSMFVKVRTQ